MSVFRAYDIRGIYGKEIDEVLAFNIAHAFVKLFRPKTVAIGHDMRSSAPAIHKSVIDGLVEAGCKVTSIGLCTTPMLYFATGYLGVDGSIMITASHNPKEYIGLKLSKKEAVPIGAGNGMESIEKMALARVRVHSPRGTLHLQDVSFQYRAFLKNLIDPIDGLCVVVDCANAMGSLDFEHMKDICGTKMRWKGLYTQLDSSFPNHEPNPLDPKNMQDLSKEVLHEKADIGIAFDGDADRVGFVDETGRIVEADLVLAAISVELLKQYPKAHFLYDLRSSNIVREEIIAHGGTANMSKVGHGFIKRQLREESGIFAAELACHFYFKETYYTDSGILCALHVLALLKKSGKKLSEIINPYRKYFRSGEINRVVPNADRVLKKIQEEFGNRGTVTLLDGIRIDTDSYWFNVRKSNTEPLIRLVVEAKEHKIMEKIRDEVLDVIGGKSH